MITAHVFISGFVQGVGFRQLIQRIAQDLRLTGWVRNLPDGRVEALAQGSKDKIEEMITICRKGPFLSEVEDVEVIWEENPQSGGEKFESFEIVM